MIVGVFVIVLSLFLFFACVDELSSSFFSFRLMLLAKFTDYTLFNLLFPIGSKRLRGAELAETIALAAGHLTNGTQNSNTSYNTNNTSNNGSSSSSNSGGAIPANVPINASAEVAAGRTKIGRSSFWNEERVSILFFSFCISFFQHWMRTFTFVHTPSRS